MFDLQANKQSNRSSFLQKLGSQCPERMNSFMKKKLTFILFSLLLITAVFSGCTSSDSSLKDGTYRAEMSAESHGYKDYVEITVLNGKIDTVVYDAQTSDGQRKSQDEDYKKSMMEGNKNAGLPETYPADYMKKLAESLVEKQDINGVDDVAGATTSSDDFKTLVKALESNMKKGDTKTVTVEK